jgi:hypothetical protein
MIPRGESPEMTLLINALKAGRSFDKYSAAAFLGVHQRNAGRYIKALRTIPRLVYVSSWRQTKAVGPWHPVIAWGDGQDAEKPGKEEKAKRRSVRSTGITWGMLLGVGR